jgi:hydrogenase maturation protein HypF
VDGTGLGADGAIWGCELLWAEQNDFVRLGHLRYATLPGGEAAIHEPWRSAIGLLLLAYEDGADEMVSQVLPNVSDDEKRRVLDIAKQRINTPLHSSCGRLFDAVAALCGLCTHATHEAHAPMALESAIRATGPKQHHDTASWRCELAEENGVAVLDPRLLVRTITEAVLEGAFAGAVACQFHESLVMGLADLLEWGAAKVGTTSVILTGGCMVNRYLSRRLSEELSRRALGSTIPSAISPGDGGVSIGQAAVAAWRRSGA